MADYGCDTPSYEKYATGYGMLEADAEPEAEIRREILEETGYRAGALEQVAEFFLSPGGSSERLHLFCASIDLNHRERDGGGLEEEGEDIEIVELGFDEALALQEDGHVTDAKTLIALMWLRRRLHG